MNGVRDAEEHSQERKNLCCEFDRARLHRRGKQAPQGRFCRTVRLGESELSESEARPAAARFLFAAKRAHARNAPAHSRTDRGAVQASQLGSGFIAFGVRHRLHSRDDECWIVSLISDSPPKCFRQGVGIRGHEPHYVMSPKSLRFSFVATKRFALISTPFGRI